MDNISYNNRAFVELKARLLHHPKRSDLEINSLIQTTITLWEQDNPNYAIKDFQLEYPTIYAMDITVKVVPKLYDLSITISKTYDEGFIL